MGTAADAAIIGARGTAAPPENDWPHCEQNAAPSDITPPHLEQYTDPSFPSCRSQGQARMAAKSYLISRGRVNRDRLIPFFAIPALWAKISQV
jgi:hypothetical protein